MTEPRLGIVILAAGEARRFGACKQLALLHTKPLLQHVIDAALPLRPMRLVVMTGKYHEAIAAAKDEGVVTGAELMPKACRGPLHASLTCDRERPNASSSSAGDVRSRLRRPHRDRGQA